MRRVLILMAMAMFVTAAIAVAQERPERARPEPNPMMELQLRERQLDLEARESEMDFERNMHELELQKRRAEIGRIAGTRKPGPEAARPSGQCGPGHKNGCAGLFFVVVAAIHVLVTVWVYRDIRQRNAGSGLWIVIALLSGLLGALVYAVVRIGDMRRAE